MKSLLAVLAILAVLPLAFATPAQADVEPPLLLEAPAMTPTDAVTCDQPAAALFPDADPIFLSGCTTTTSCGSYSYDGCCSSGTRVRLKRTCTSKCCNSSGQCLTSGSYTEKTCSQIAC